MIDRSVVDVSATSACSTLAELLAARDSDEDLRRAREYGERQDLGSVVLYPPIPAPHKIFAVGANYHSHIDEIGRDIPDHPVVFIRFPDTFVGSGLPIVSPAASATLDWEGELAVVIGRPCSKVPPEEALRFVAGSTCCAENSVREYQFHGTQVTPGKNFARSGALGPWLVTLDELDPRDLAIQTRIDDEVVQDDRTSNLVFDLPTIISYISAFAPLNVGDVITTGTPAGVGVFRDPPRYLEPGQHLSVEIEGIGILSNPVARETSV